MSLSPAAILHDVAGNALKVVTDGADYLLGVAAKLRNAAGTVINPATEDTLTSIKDTAGVKKITDPLPAGTNNIGDVDVVSSALPAGAATEATLDTRATETTAAVIQTVLEAIRDTAGVKKITDQLPVGTNRIGAVRLLDILDNGINSALNNAIRRLEARSSLTSPDGSLDVGVVTDNSINRVETRSTIVGQVDGSGVEAKVTTIQDIQEPTQQRLQAESRIAPGSTVNIGTGIPANPADLVLAFCTNVTSEDLLVDGSVTEVHFDFSADPANELSIEELLIVFAADDFEFDGASFGPNTSLSNGVSIQSVLSGVTTEIFNIQQNEDFLRIPGRPPIVNNTGPKDILAAAFSFGGVVKLAAGSADKIRITVRDDLTSSKLKYFTGTAYAAKG